MKGYLEVFPSRDGWRFALVAANGERVAQSEGYTTASNARRTARRLGDQLRWRVVTLPGRKKR